MTTTQLNAVWTLVDDADPEIIYQGPWNALKGISTDVNAFGYSPMYGTLHTADNLMEHYSISYIFNATSFVINLGGSIIEESFSCQVDGIPQEILSYGSGIHCLNSGTLSRTEHTLFLSFHVKSGVISFDALHFIPAALSHHHTRQSYNRSLKLKDLNVEGVRRDTIFNNNQNSSPSTITVTVTTTTTLSPQSGVPTPSSMNATASSSSSTASNNQTPAHIAISPGVISALILSAIVALLFAFWLGRRSIRKQEVKHNQRDSESLGVSPFTPPSFSQINPFPLAQHTTREKNEKYRRLFSRRVVAIGAEETSRPVPERFYGDTGLVLGHQDDIVEDAMTLPPAYMTSTS